MKILKDIPYSRKGDVCKLDLYLPENTEGQMPVYVRIHGGGLVEGDKDVWENLVQALAEKGIALASINYRMYPEARFPDYLVDAAEAVAFLMREYPELGNFAVGGESAGGYITQMLYFNKALLENAGADRNRIKAFVMDAGQPTTHFNVLTQERHMDGRAVVIDEAASLYYLREPYTQPEKEPYVAIFAAEHDMVNRLEQNKMLETAMLHFGFSREKLLFHEFMGVGHCCYCHTGEYAQMLADFLNKAFTA